MLPEPFVSDPDFTLYVGDAHQVLRSLPSGSAHACVTSPPYLDARPEYPSPSLQHFEWIFTELRRVVTGPALVNVGRLWAEHCEQLWWILLVEAAASAGWSLLDTLVWAKPNANPIRGEVFADSHEYVLVLGDPGMKLNVDAVRTAYTQESLDRMARRWVNGRGTKGDERGDQLGRAVNELGARPRSVVPIYVGGEKGNPHPAPMPLELAVHLVRLAAREGETIIDPFAGSCTTARAARLHGRLSVAIERDLSYAEFASRRLSQQTLEGTAAAVGQTAGSGTAAINGEPERVAAPSSALTVDDARADIPGVIEAEA